MTYREILVMRNNLDLVDTIRDANPKFLYAVAKMKARLDSIMKTLDSLKKPSEKIQEFWQKLDEINKKHAETDESGTVLYTSVTMDGQHRKAYKKVIGEGNPESKYTKEVDKLKEKYKSEIDEYEANVKKYNAMLDEKLPDGELRMHFIDLDIVPAGLNPKAMDGCLPFIKDIPDPKDEEPEKEENTKTKKEEKK
jgi:hypothetical protein